MTRFQVTADASGAAAAGSRGEVVVVVDVIDMSTTAEALWEEGVVGVWGASPLGSRAPVALDPEGIGFRVGQSAASTGREVILIAEPRVGTDGERLTLCRPVLAGLGRAGIEPAGIYANLGAETVKGFSSHGKIALLVTDTGGTAFDAALRAGAAAVTTATVARTRGKRGIEPALAGLKRAEDLAHKLDRPITFVAASANSLEDVLAAEFLANLLLTRP